MKIFQLIISGLCFLISISEFLSRRSRVIKERKKLEAREFNIKKKQYFNWKKKESDLKELDFEKFNNKAVKIGNILMFIIFTLASILLILK